MQAQPDLEHFKEHYDNFMKDNSYLFLRSGESFGESIKKYRRSFNLTQAELGELINLNKMSISRMEKNLQMPPYAKVLTLIKIFSFFQYIVEFKPDELLNSNLTIEQKIDLLLSLSKIFDDTQKKRVLKLIERKGLEKISEIKRISPFHFKTYFEAMKRDFENIKEFSALGLKGKVSLRGIYVSLKVVEKSKIRLSPEKPIEEGTDGIVDLKSALKVDIVSGTINEPHTDGIVDLKSALKGIFDSLLEERIDDVLKRDRPVSETRHLREFEEFKEEVLDAEEAIKKFHKTVIVGVPGSGKTTLLKYFALKIADENLNQKKVESIPIPITIRELEESNKTIREFINDVLKKYEFPESEQLIEKELEDGRAVLLLDGFDELAQKDRQERVVNLIREFTKQYPDNRIIVSSRIAGYHDDLPDFKKLELMDFNDEQIKNFVKNWFSDGARADKIIKAIFEHDSIKALARNPLLVSIIAVIYEEDKELPQRRADLYKRSIEVLLARWDKERRIKNVYPSSTKEFILKKLALECHRKRKRVMKEDEVKEIMLGYFPQVGLQEKDYEQFINEIYERNWILRQPSYDTYDFLHLSFQEYLAAWELMDNNDYQTLIENVYDPWWREVILLFAGIKRDAAELINKINEEIEEDVLYHKLRLLGSCIADAEFTKVETKDRVLKDLFHVFHNCSIPK